MVVKRVSDLDIHRRAFITAIGGNIDDSFIDEDLCSYAFEQQLYLYLKKEGYNRILFYNRASGFNLYAYDRESLTSLYPDNNHKETTKRSPLGKVNLLGKPAKMEDNNASDSNANIKSRDYNGRKYFYISNFRDTTLVQTVQDVVRNTTYRSVIFFTSTSFDLGERQTFIDSISHTYNEVAALSSPNKILIRYSTSGIFKSDFFANVLKSSDNVFNVGTPDKQEYKNWVNAQRIKGNISAEAIFSFPFNALTDQLYRLGQKLKALDTELQLKRAGFIDGLKPSPFDRNMLFEELKKVRGQQDNIQVIVGELTRWLRKATKTKPLVFMFAGTSGTGKTFTTKCIHASLASGGFNFIRLNMNEYHSENDARKLLGSPQGYVDSEKDAPLFAAHKKSGGKLVILFDEIEKAHPSLFTTIMSLMDEGTLSNGKGEEYNFKQSIIIFTTNLAQERLLSQKQRLISQHIEITNRQFQDNTKQILKNAGLSNEICGRINWLLVYNALDASTTAQIALEQIRMVGKEYNITINSAPLSYLQEIAEECAGNNEGARPIESSIRNRLEPVFQDAYDANVCLPDVIYDIDDQFQLALSNEDKWISLDDIVINMSKTIHFDKDQLTDSLNAVKGQQDNIQLIAAEISIWIRDSFKEAPLVFMLAGTSGTGKTFTVETIDRALPEYKMVKLNMNEYHSEADSWKLLGSSAGHIGSDKDSPLFAARRETDKLIILFDEIEKAHPSLFTTIMTLTEKGEMGNGHGEIFDFKESLIFFTTNLSMKELLKYKQDAIKNNVPVSSPEFQDAAKNILKTAGLKDEISGRLNWVLVYNALDASMVAQIVVDNIRKIGKKYGILINRVPLSYLDEVARSCAGNSEGARPVNRMVTRKVKPIFQSFIESETCELDTLYDIDDQFQIVPSSSEEMVDVNDVKIEVPKTEHFDKDQLLESLKAVKGQQDNMQLIADEINIWIRDAVKESPLVFMLAGTSGTGKTFTVETIDRALPEYKMVKLNMNEYHSEADSWKLLGSSTGYIGSDKESPLFSARRETDKLIILFDEIEKAHPSLFTTIMTLMEKGKMGNGHGEIFDFKESLIFFTTNLSMKELLKYKQDAIKNDVPVSSPAFQDAAKNIIKTAGLKDEISGRLNWVLIYNALDASMVAQIVVENIRKIGKKYGILINRVPLSYLDEVARSCAGNNEGARPVNRMVTRKVKPIFQDAYDSRMCQEGMMYDIDDNFRLIPSLE